MLLLCISLAVMAFFIGIEVQKRRLGSLGALASTINILVLDNPMKFQFSQFLDSALGQIVGCFLALMVILLVRDNSQARTGRVLLNQFVSAAVSSLTTNTARRKENHLPALYQQLFLLLNKFPGDIARFRLALTLIIAHQRLRDAPVPVTTICRHFTASCDVPRTMSFPPAVMISAATFARLLEELDVYQEKLQVWEASPQVTEPVRRLVEMLHKYQHVLTNS
jgi:p-hydroxybenzoic acid efflux pump subunit AaeB